MKKQLFLGLLILFSVGVFAHTNQTSKGMNKYRSQWEQVEKFEKDNLPKSALSVVNRIFKDAVSSKDTPQTIKSLLYINKYKISIDNETDISIFSDIDSLITISNKADDKALLHSLIAEVYLNYYDAVRWQISNRTDIVGYIPKDIKEWTGNIFKDKAAEHLKASVGNESELLKQPVLNYKDILIEGEDSRTLYPTLYDFLIKRAIDQSARMTNSYRGSQFADFDRSLKSKGLKASDLALPASDFLKLDFSDNDNLLILGFYQSALKSFKARNMNESVVFTELDRHNYLMRTVGSYTDKYAKDFLLNLERENEAYNYNVEVIYALTQLLQRTGEPDKEDNLTRIYDWCQLGLKKYPKYSRINLLKDVLYNIESPYAQIKGKEVYHPDTKKKTFTLLYRNLKYVNLRIIDKNTQQEVKKQTVNLNPKSTYSQESIDFDIDLNKIGNYNLVIGFDKSVSNDKSERCEFTISRLANFVRNKSQDVYEFYIVDRLTGAPVSDAVITIKKSDSKNIYNDIDQVKTDSKGFAVYDLSRIYNRDKGNLYSYRYSVSKGDDKQNVLAYFSYSYNFQTNEQSGSKEIINLFTDRSIYRPGQTVYLKAVNLLQGKEGEFALAKNKQYNVELFNVNGERISEKSLTTNDFGSVSGEFVLPKDGLTGQYSIKVGDSYTYFMVEEYKRPTFQVTFDKIDKAYAFGDKVKIIGHVENFSGIKLQDAEVSYNVIQRPFFRWWYGGATETIDNGTVVTNADGSFEVSFVIPQRETSNSRLFGNQIYNYEITASVTDQNGETQEGTSSFVVGDVSVILSTDIGDKIDKASDKKIKVNSTNLNGENISLNGTYVLYSLHANDSINLQVKTGEFKSEETDLMGIMRSLPSAKYQLALSAKDDKGRNVTAKENFVLYSYNDKQPPIESNEWLVEKKTTFSTAQSAEIAFGVSARDITVLYEIAGNNRVFERRQIKFNNSIEKFTIPYKSEYDKNAVVSFTYIIDEKPYTQQIVLTKEDEKKDLNLKFQVFRDKLKPGQQEEWRISVKDNIGKPAFSELLASMYDSSLDKLNSPNPWNLITASYSPSTGVDLFQRGGGFDDLNQYFYFDNTGRPSYKSMSIDRLNLFGFSFSSNNRIVIRGMSSVPQPAPAPAFAVERLSGSVQGIMDMKSESSVQFTPPVITDDAGIVDNIADKSPVQIRSNFNETAFFYPQLRTDKNGETIISFTVPESNTTWRFRALAYDQNLDTGSLEAIAVSRKELMVTPNMPRFIRQGDKASISTKISNLSDKTVSGKVRLVFFDPVTDLEKDIKLENKSQIFELAKDASSSVTWLFDVPSDIDMLGVKVIAESESFSDGEQHVLPVLSNRMLVTESMNMNLNKSQTKDFVFDRFVNNKSNSSSNYRLTFEYTGNPAWYAVQALPVLSNPTNENAVNWFASYYVNVLGNFISHQYPKVASMIATWKKQGEDKNTMVSKLMQNDELKQVLLEETPWVLEAKDETEQMERLSLLLDLNNSKNQADQAIVKLQELQREDGGWAWYKGMYSSRSITQYVLYGFTQLTHLNAVEYGEKVKVMQMNALKYIDSQILKEYEDLKRFNKDWQKVSYLSTNQLEYLYVRSFYRDIPIDQKTREAERFYTSIAERNWTKLNLYEQSLLAVLASQNGNKILNNKIINSLREHATINDEMGMFWANNEIRSFMGQSAVTVHTFLMDAFKNANASDDEMDRMKQWLLKQKQTQLWESTHATIDAIYALLSSGNDWFAASGNSKITINDRILDTKSSMPGVDYIKQSWSGSDITSGMGRVSISKTSEGPSWGTMYWQYYEDLDKVTDQKGVLNVDKKLFVEQSSIKGKSLVEVSESTPLKVGDKVIIRLTIRSDRDMEFVQLKDMRASCFEPAETLSGIKWRESTYYYQSTKDASTNFFFDLLPKGTYVFEYPVFVNRVGDYSNGITTIQCLYAPEYISHTSGTKVVIK